MSRVKVSLTFFLFLHILAFTFAPLSLSPFLSPYQGPIVTFAFLCVGVDHLAPFTVDRCTLHLSPFFPPFFFFFLSMCNLHLHLAILLRYFCDHFRSPPLDSPSTQRIMRLSLAFSSLLESSSLLSCLKTRRKKAMKKFTPE